MLKRSVFKLVYHRYCTLQFLRLYSIWQLVIVVFGKLKPIFRIFLLVEVCIKELFTIKNSFNGINVPNHYYIIITYLKYFYSYLGSTQKLLHWGNLKTNNVSCNFYLFYFSPQPPRTVLQGHCCPNYSVQHRAATFTYMCKIPSQIVRLNIDDKPDKVYK